VEFKRWMGQKDRKRFPTAQRAFSAEELSAEVLTRISQIGMRIANDVYT